MATIRFVPQYITLSKDGKEGSARGYVVNLKTRDLVPSNLTVAVDAKLVPFTQKGLERLQSKGFFQNVSVEPVLGVTAYNVELDDQGRIVKMSYRWTKEMREQARTLDKQRLAKAGVFDDDGEDDYFDSTTILQHI